MTHVRDDTCTYVRGGAYGWWGRNNRHGGLVERLDSHTVISKGAVGSAVGSCEGGMKEKLTSSGETVRESNAEKEQSLVSS